jgi:hypothetical protein
LTPLAGARAQAVSPQRPSSIDSVKQAADLEKTRLEIRKLTAEVAAVESSRIPAKLSDYVPLVTAIVTVAGAFAALTRYLEDRRATRAARFEEQLRADLEELIKFSGVDTGGAARVRFLLQDLTRLCRELPERGDDVTAVVVEVAIRDLDFVFPRHVVFETAALEQWAPYPAFLRTHASEHQIILGNYVQAFRRLHDEAPGFFETLEYRSPMFVMAEYVDDSLYRRFAGLLDGLALHVPLLDDGHPELRAYARERFQAAMRNSALTLAVFDRRQQ